MDRKIIGAFLIRSKCYTNTASVHPPHIANFIQCVLHFIVITRNHALERRVTHNIVVAAPNGFLSFEDLYGDLI